MKNFSIITTALICSFAASIANAGTPADSVALGSIPVGSTIIIKKIGTNDFCAESGYAHMSFQISKRQNDVWLNRKRGKIRFHKDFSSDTCLLENLSINQSIRLKISSVSKETVEPLATAHYPYKKQTVTIKFTNQPLIKEILFETGSEETAPVTGEPIDLTVGDLRKLSEGMMDIELPDEKK